MAIEYIDIKAQKINCKFIGSIKIDKKVRKIFTDTRYADLWLNTTKSMNINACKALCRGLPHRKQLSQVDRADMQTYFYDAVINAIYPHDNCCKTYPFNEVDSYTINVEKEIQLLQHNPDSKAYVSDISFYNYPYGITLFVINMSWENVPLDVFTKISSSIRDVEHYYRKVNDEKIQIVTTDFLSLFNPILRLYNELSDTCDSILLNDYSYANVSKYINILHKANKLKSYVTLRLAPDSEAMLSDNYSCKHLLYDVATLSKIGTAVDTSSVYKPSDHYFEKLMTDNLIDCFDEWTALSLVDSFCCVMSPFDSTREDYQYNLNWGKYYFEYLYLNVLYVKVFMLDANDKFILDTPHTRLYDSIRDIDRTFNHYNVSYNFLPDIVYKTIRTGMEIDDELDAIKIQISNHENRAEHKREKKLNIMISFLTCLSIFSVLNDGLGFIQNVWGDLWYYNYLSYIFLSIVIVLIGGIIYYFNKE